MSHDITFLSPASCFLSLHITIQIFFQLTTTKSFRSSWNIFVRLQWTDVFHLILFLAIQDFAQQIAIFAFFMEIYLLKASKRIIFIWSLFSATQDFARLSSTLMTCSLHLYEQMYSSSFITFYSHLKYWSTTHCLHSIHGKYLSKASEWM